MVDIGNQDQKATQYPLPWDRFWARCIDLFLQAVLCFLIWIFSGIGSWVSGTIHKRDLQDISHLTNPHFWQVYLIFFAMMSLAFFLYEVFSVSVLGATPGQILFKIKIADREGRKLNFYNAFKRSIYLFWFGYYFYNFTFHGFIIGYWLSSRYYKKRGTFRWDQASDSIINQETLTRTRKRVYRFLAMCCLFVCMVPVPEISFSIGSLIGKLAL